MSEQEHNPPSGVDQDASQAPVTEAGATDTAAVASGRSRGVEAGGNRIVVEKGQLLAEFDQLARLLLHYGAILGESDDSEGWEDSAVQRLRKEQALPARMRFSLGTVDLAVALLKEVLSRITVEEITFLDNHPESLQPLGHTSAEAVDDPLRLVSWINACAGSAPLDLRERLGQLLGAVRDIFQHLMAADSQAIESDMGHINLITANPYTQNLVREIAIITRDVLSTLQSVTEGLPLDSLTESSGGIVDAIDKLNSVIQRLDAAAAANLDSLEALLRSSEQGKEELAGAIDGLRKSQAALTALKKRRPELSEQVDAIQEQLSDAVGGSVMTLWHHEGQNPDIYMELISNQSFQELNSRTLRKIISFTEGLESKLRELLVQFRPELALQPARASSLQGMAADDEPAASGTQQTQEQVDGLLDELGF